MHNVYYTYKFYKREYNKIVYFNIQIFKYVLIYLNIIVTVWKKKMSKRILVNPFLLFNIIKAVIKLKYKINN